MVFVSSRQRSNENKTQMTQIEPGRQEGTLIRHMWQYRTWVPPDLDLRKLGFDAQPFWDSNCSCWSSIKSEVYAVVERPLFLHQIPKFLWRQHTSSNQISQVWVEIVLITLCALFSPQPCSFLLPPKQNFEKNYDYYITVLNIYEVLSIRMWTL